MFDTRLPAAFSLICLPSRGYNHSHGLKIKIPISHVSRTLKELEELKLIKCLTSEKIKKGKIFAMSDESKVYIEEITRNLKNNQ